MEGRTSGSTVSRCSRYQAAVHRIASSSSIYGWNPSSSSALRSRGTRTSMSEKSIAAKRTRERAPSRLITRLASS